MQLFRSEEHLTPWLERRGLDLGATMTVEQGWRLGRDWYGDRLSPGWRRRTPAEARQVFDAIGLTGPFWRLT